MSLARFMIAAPASGSGKTTVTCGILQALVNRGMKVSSFKCGPDYIDPMFHARVIGTKSRNMDSYFCDDETLKYLFCRTAEDSDISVIEAAVRLSVKKKPIFKIFSSSSVSINKPTG